MELGKKIHFYSGQKKLAKKLVGQMDSNGLGFNFTCPVTVVCKFKIV